MKKKLHPEMKLTTFTCASCGATYQIMSTSKQVNVSIDVCSKCHPVFVGKTVENAVKGRAEKLSHKFTAKTVAPKTKKVRKTSNKKKIIKDLSKLNA